MKMNVACEGMALTPREYECLQLMAQGMRGTAIARQMCVTYNTKRDYQSAVVRKLGGKTAAHAVALAFRGGLLT